MPVEVSVIVPLFRAENTVGPVVEKLLRQTGVTFEIVLVDDGSPDATFEIAQQLAVEYPAVRAFALAENGGVAAARERAADESTGKYVWMIDDDDDWADDSLSILVGEARRSGADVVVGGASYVYSTGVAPRAVGDPTLSGDFSTREAFCLFLSGRISGHLWNKLFDRSLLQRIEFTRATVHSDHAMVAQLLSVASRVTATKRPVYRYQVRTGSIVRSGKRRGESLAKVHEVVVKAASRMHPRLDDTADFVYYYQRYVVSSALKDAVSGAYPLDEEKAIFAQFRAEIDLAGVLEVARRRDYRRVILLLTAFLGRPVFHYLFSGR